ncbi:unnamed protein product [Leptosia nina]|uniref:tRNA pseudouridine(55) synthase n=1 Tax=Leptosia nina TaxID=320188 RepID=A0AAV1JAP8_9NEOP
MFLLRALIPYILVLTQANVNIRKSGWLDRLVEFHRFNFINDLQKIPAVQLKADIVPAPPGYIDSEKWDFPSVIRLLSLIRQSEGLGPVRRAIRHALQSTRRMGIKDSLKLFPSLKKHLPNDLYYEIEESVEYYNDVNTPKYSENKTLDDAIILVSNPVEARLPSAMISVNLLKFVKLAMDDKLLFKFCKSLGCCDSCCFRYMGNKKSSVYENVKTAAEKFQETIVPDSAQIRSNLETDTETDIVKPLESGSKIQNDPELEEISGSTTDKMDVDGSNHCTANIASKSMENMESNGTTTKDKSNPVQPSIDLSDSMPPSKKLKLDVCVSCLGVLQDSFWDDTFAKIKEALVKKGYECKTYTCGLSAPISTILREKVITLKIAEAFSDYDPNIYTQLKDAWKMSFRQKVSEYIDKSFDIDSPLLIMVHLDYPDDLQELEVLKKVSPILFENRNRYKRRFPTEFTRQSVEQALEDVKLETLMSSGVQMDAHGHAQCVSVVCAHAPAYLGGRYIKLSRNLPQTPWILKKQRVLPNSVEEIIFKPLAKIFKFSDGDVETRLKFISAGREDVDVRCLGDGRPFAIEISDPIRQLTNEELQCACAEISTSGDVVVKSFSYLTKDDLIQLKKGEETKCKTYEALCIKLTHSKFDKETSGEVKVTQEDIDFINTYRNTEPTDPVRVNITQKTPIRVLHRRPLLTRTRQILDITAKTLPGHPQLFLLRIQTSAGTYVKEWVHGELSRTYPSLSHALSADVDLLALDVTEVHLQWPPIKG